MTQENKEDTDQFILDNLPLMPNSMFMAVTDIISSKLESPITAAILNEYHKRLSGALQGINHDTGN